MAMEGLKQAQERMLRSYTSMGVTLIVAAPAAWFLAPFGFVIGPLAALGGIGTLMRAQRLRDEIKRAAK